jgi:hypothetical protein
MKKLMLICLMALVSIPAWAAKPAAKSDPSCEKMGQVAEGLYKLRDIGYTVGQMDQFTTESTVQKFPIQALKRYVYDMKDVTSTTINQSLTTLCNNVGFEVFNRYLVQDDEMQRLKIENASLVTKNAEANQKVIGLESELRKLYDTGKIRSTTNKVVNK